MKWLTTYNRIQFRFCYEEIPSFFLSIYLISMVEKFQGVIKTVFGNVSGHGEIQYKSQFSVDYEGNYDIPTKYAQGEW